jgi:uncharacterized protein (UPF0305 family)
MAEETEVTNEATLANSLCKQLAETLTAWDRDRREAEKSQTLYLKTNIEALLQGNADIKKDTGDIAGRMDKIEELVDRHDTAIQKLERYASIENTAIRIALAVIIAVGVMYFFIR